MNQWFIMLNLTQISHLDISFSLLYTTNFTFVITNDDCNLFFYNPLLLEFKGAISARLRV